MDLIDAPPRVSEPRQRFEFPAARPDRNFGSGSLVPMSLVGLSAFSSHAATIECDGIFIIIDPGPILTTAVWQPSDPAGITSWFEANRFLWGCHVMIPDLRAGSLLASCRRGLAGVPDMLQEIATAFSLTTSRLAEVMLASRQTVYEWRAGQAPHPKARRRIREIYELAQEWLRQTRSPVGDGLEWRDPESGRSLEKLLAAPVVDSAAILTHLRRLAPILEDSWAGADRDIAETAKRPGAFPPSQWQRAMRRHLGRKG